MMTCGQCFDPGVRGELPSGKDRLAGVTGRAEGWSTIYAGARGKIPPEGSMEDRGGRVGACVGGRVRAMAGGLTYPGVRGKVPPKDGEEGDQVAGGVGRMVWTGGREGWVVPSRGAGQDKKTQRQIEREGVGGGQGSGVDLPRGARGEIPPK